jgi:hypothetical protein
MDIRVLACHRSGTFHVRPDRLDLVVAAIKMKETQKMRWGFDLRLWLFGIGWDRAEIVLSFGPLWVSWLRK